MKTIIRVSDDPRDRELWADTERRAYTIGGALAIEVPGGIRVWVVAGSTELAHEALELLRHVEWTREAVLAFYSDESFEPHSHAVMRHMGGYDFHGWPERGGRL